MMATEKSTPADVVPLEVIEELAESVKQFRLETLFKSKNLAADTEKFLRGLKEKFDELTTTLELERYQAEAASEDPPHTTSDITDVIEEVVDSTPDAQLRAKLNYLIECIRRNPGLDARSLAIQTLCAIAR